MDFKNSDDKDALLTEYKLAQEMHIYYGKSLWQIGSIFFAISIAGFAFGLQNDLSAIKFAFLSGFLTVLLGGFLAYAKRHSRLAFLYISRCREIEEMLGLGQHSNKYFSDKHKLTVGDECFEPKKFTGKHITLSIPIFLIGIFWAYTILKYFGMIG